MWTASIIFGSVLWTVYTNSFLPSAHRSSIKITLKDKHMTTQIYVNLPVKNLDKSIEFFSRLGYKFNPQFTDENATCMIVGDNIFVMLLVEKFFQTFTRKAICDARKSTEVLMCLSCDSRADVEEQVRKAVAAGATTPRAPQDQGWMYGHGFEDLDGHIWELAYMDMSAMPQGQQQAETAR